MSRTMRLEGFAKAMAIPDQSLKAARYTQEWYLHALATKMRNDMRAAIDSGGQGYKWKPLNTAYREWKVSKGFSPLIWKMRGDLYKAIAIVPISKRAVFVGIPKDAKNSDGESIATYAAINEKGSVVANIPPRPLVSPTSNRVLAWAKENKSLFVGKFLDKLDSDLIL